ncbi:hypothetical protein AAVH_38138, partial [Aphelenchoides avenae]
YEASSNKDPTPLQRLTGALFEWLAPRVPPSRAAKMPKKKKGKKKKKHCVDEGLCARGSHYEDRNICVGEFARIYGYNPLVMSSYTAVPTC